MRKTNKPIRQLISSVLAMFVCLAVILTGMYSFAWFSDSQNAAVTGGYIQTSVPGSQDAQITPHPVTNIESETQYTFLESETISTIPLYDEWGLEETDYRTALVLTVRIPEANAGDRFTMSVHATGPLVQTLENYFSNCVKMTYATVTSADASGNPISTVANDPAWQSFVTVTNGVGSKVDTVTLPTQTLHAGENVFYLIFTYDEKVLQYVGGYISSGTSVSNDEITKYYNDISFEFSNS